jgi:pimeloyl-ACP methyl ester carboxylesterase
MPKLAENGYRSIAPDWLGCGFSSKPDPLDFDYTPDRLITALEDLLNTLNLAKIHLVVQGFLGSVGLQFAIRHPERIGKLTILNTPLTPNVKLPWKLKQLSLPLIGDMITQDPLIVDRVLESGSKFVVEEQFLKVYRKPFLTTSDTGRCLLKTMKNLQLNKSTLEISSGLPNLDLPIQVIWGMKDPWLDLEDIKPLIQSCKNAELIELTDGAHYPQEHFYPQISDYLVNFLRRSS